MSRKLYLVCYSRGEYSDREEKRLFATAQEAVACETVTNITSFIAPVKRIDGWNKYRADCLRAQAAILELTGKNVTVDEYSSAWVEEVEELL